MDLSFNGAHVAVQWVTWELSWEKSSCFSGELLRGTSYTGLAGKSASLDVIGGNFFVILCVTG